MVEKKTIIDSDFRYIDKKGNLIKTRMQFSIAKLLSFLEYDYEYNYKIKLDNNSINEIDFKTEKGLIKIIEKNEDIHDYEKIKKYSNKIKIIAIGNSKYIGNINELNDMMAYDDNDNNDTQTGSIFIDDPSFAFDYAHILPLVNKCSILHGHTSSVFIELAGIMHNNLLIDFSDAKKIIKEVISILDHKFFINKKYLSHVNKTHYKISFDGPKGMFNLDVPKNTTYLLEGEATVENLSTEIIKMLSNKLPKNIEAVGVYIYEGNNKGAHIISRLKN